MKNIPEIYQKHIQAIVSTMREFLQSGKELSAITFLGKFNAGIAPIPMDCRSERSKDESAALVLAVAQEVKPDFVVMISEAWTLPEGTTEEQMKKIYAEYGSVAAYPHREEIVCISLETRQGDWLGRSHIKKLDNGKRDFDDVKFLRVDGIAGRFTHFLPKDTLQ